MSRTARDMYQAWNEISEQIMEQARIIDAAQKRIDQLGKLLHQARYQLSITIPCPYDKCQAPEGVGCDFGTEIGGYAIHLERESAARAD